MKTTITVFFLLLSICVLPLTISASSPFIRLPTEAGSPVLDTRGNTVVGGSLYYARASEKLVRGGISVTNFNDSAICPTYAYLNLGIPPQPRPPTLTPIIFHPLDDPTGVVYESDPIYVEFYEDEPCPTMWNLFQNIIVAGYGPSKFSIKASDSSNSYIFSGIGIVDNQNRLGIADTPYDFQFDRIILQ